MSVCGDDFGFVIVAIFTILFLKTGFGTSWMVFNIPFTKSMAVCLNVIVNIAIAAAIAGIGCIALFGTGGFCYNRHIVMSKRRNDSGFEIITNRAILLFQSV